MNKFTHTLKLNHIKSEF